MESIYGVNQTNKQNAGLHQEGYQDRNGKHYLAAVQNLMASTKRLLCTFLILASQNACLRRKAKKAGTL